MAKLPRRKFLHVAAGAVALPMLSRHALALDYPTRPVRVIVGLPAGNSPDIVARITSKWLAQKLGQPFLVENRPGANTNIATGFVLRAPADGYTLLLAVAGNAINSSVYKDLNFVFNRDIAPVASIGGAPLVMVVVPTVPAKTVPEFIAYAKANAGKVLMGSSGNGSLIHVSGALFDMMTGVDLVHVPYKESLFPDLLGGRVQVAFEPSPAVLGFIRSGQLRALAVTSKQRLAVLPDVPALNEFVPGYESIGWLGVVAPKGTPAAIIDKLNMTINAGLSDPELKGGLTDLAVIPNPMTPAEFGKFIADDTEKWAKVVKFADIKPD
jgi:tripartite-type tricarboxylate transporter receptor subunit TctC